MAEEESEYDFDDEFSSEDIDDDDDEAEMVAVDGGVGEQEKPADSAEKKAANDDKKKDISKEAKRLEFKVKGKLRNRQMYFGGLPLAKEKATMVVDSAPAPERLEAIQKKIRERPKKFSTETFLDLFLQD